MTVSTYNVGKADLQLKCSLPTISTPLASKRLDLALVMCQYTYNIYFTRKYVIGRRVLWIIAQYA